MNGASVRSTAYSDRNAANVRSELSSGLAEARSGHSTTRQCSNAMDPEAAILISVVQDQPAAMRSGWSPVVRLVAPLHGRTPQPRACIPQGQAVW